MIDSFPNSEEGKPDLLSDLENRGLIPIDDALRIRKFRESTTQGERDGIVGESFNAVGGMGESTTASSPLGRIIRRHMQDPNRDKPPARYSTNLGVPGGITYEEWDMLPQGVKDALRRDSMY